MAAAPARSASAQTGRSVRAGRVGPTRSARVHPEPNDTSVSQPEPFADRAAGTGERSGRCSGTSPHAAGPARRRRSRCRSGRTVCHRRGWPAVDQLDQRAEPDRGSTWRGLADRPCFERSDVTAGPDRGHVEGRRLVRSRDRREVGDRDGRGVETANRQAVARTTVRPAAVISASTSSMVRPGTHHSGGHLDDTARDHPEDVERHPGHHQIRSRRAALQCMRQQTRDRRHVLLVCSDQAPWACTVEANEPGPTWL